MKRDWIRVTDTTAKARRGSVVIARGGLDIRTTDSAGMAGAQRASAEDVRSFFNVIAHDDEGYRVINTQREAVLAPAWARALAWLPAALADHAGVLADVEPSMLGLVQEAASRVGLHSRRGMRTYFPRWGGLAYLVGEVLGKGLLAPRRPRSAAVDVLFYAEVPNHWRHLGPVASELEARGYRVGFMSAAVQGAVPKVAANLPAEHEYSLDRLAIGLGILPRLAAAAVLLRSPVVESEHLSPSAQRGLRSRARFARLVYEKARTVAFRVDCRVFVLGDAAAHRPAGLCHGFREMGVPTVSMQHGVITDRVRYRQESEVFLVWDERSAASHDGESECRVVGAPGLEIEMAAAGDYERDPRGASLLAPTVMGTPDLVAWIDSAQLLARSLLPDGSMSLRLHPSTPEETREAIARRCCEVALVGRSQTVAASILASDYVVSNGSSILQEATLLGRVPVEWPTGLALHRELQGVPLMSTQPVPPETARGAGVVGSTARAADVIEGLVRGLDHARR